MIEKIADINTHNGADCQAWIMDNRVTLNSHLHCRPTARFRVTHNKVKHSFESIPREFMHIAAESEGHSFELFMTTEQLKTLRDGINATLREIGENLT